MNLCNFHNAKETSVLSIKPCVSVIIPVYNVEKYIDNCIESLKKQSLHDLEIIFIDDKSTDASMEKLHVFAASDPRVRIFPSEKNQGAGPARNIGIEHAQGEYLAFADPDDHMDSDFYERLYYKATENKKHDIAKGCRRKIAVDGTVIEEASCALNDRIREETKEGEPLFVIFNYEHTTAIYSRHLFENTDLRYGQERKSEDVTFLFILCNKTDDIVFDDAAVYSYVQRSDSTSKILSYERHLAEIRSWGEMIKWIKRNRKMDLNDYRYMSLRFQISLRDYKADMQKAPALQSKFDDYISEFFSVINLADDPGRLINGSWELKQLYASLPEDKKYALCPALDTPSPYML